MVIIWLEATITPSSGRNKECRKCIVMASFATFVKLYMHSNKVFTGFYKTVSKVGLESLMTCHITKHHHVRYANFLSLSDVTQYKYVYTFFSHMI